jgi:hypothetical protein
VPDTCPIGFCSGPVSRHQGDHRCRSGEPGQCLSDGPVPILGGVLVAQGGRRGGVPESGHQFLRRSAGRRGEGRSKVPQVVQVQVAESNVCPRSVRMLLEDVGTKRPP